jgi:hypothetical protein
MNRYHMAWLNGIRTTLQRKVYQDEFGKIPEGFMIHHVDGNPLNNNPNNLVAMSRSDHQRHHVGKWFKVDGNYFRECNQCGALKPESAFRRAPHSTHGICRKCEYVIKRENLCG